MSDEHLCVLADLFHLLGDPTRLRIVRGCLARPIAVGALAQTLGLSASLVSHHLRLLGAARIVRADRQGKHVFYAAADHHIRDTLHNLLEHVAEARAESAPKFAPQSESGSRADAAPAMRGLNHPPPTDE